MLNYRVWFDESSVDGVNGFGSEEGVDEGTNVLGGLNWVKVLEANGLSVDTAFGYETGALMFA